MTNWRTSLNRGFFANDRRLYYCLSQKNHYLILGVWDIVGRWRGERGVFGEEGFKEGEGGEAYGLLENDLDNFLGVDRFEHLPI